MDVRKLVYDTFVKPFENREYGNVGVELEFPLVNTKKENVDENVAKGVFEHFLKKGFQVEIEENGQPLFITNDDGDCLSFDNSYNNFEFAMNYSDNLCDIEERFVKLLGEVQSYFKAHNHTIVGIGSNPYKKYAQKSHVDFSTYNMVDEYLEKFGKDSPYPDFPAYLSSAQTHLDVPVFDLPRAYTLYAKMDFVRALLFSNSPDFEKTGYICYRDYLWEQSAFSLCPNITGKVDNKFETTDDIVDYFAQKGIFNRKRDGKYEIFSPVSLEEYFARPDAKESDMDYYLSFKNVELTRRGTLEIRSDCAQPFSSALAPAAFNTGILFNMYKAESILTDFIKTNKITKTNTELRNEVISGKVDMEDENLYNLLSDMLECSRKGLEKRGKGEERLLLPLYDRVARMSNPGMEAYGMDEDELVAEYSVF